MRIAPRVERLELSVTLALDARARELARTGRDVVNLSVGEPDFPAPRVAREAAVAKVESGDVRYGPAGGTAELRDALATHVAASRGVPCDREEIVVCHSAKHALSGTLLALVEAGDEVLIPLPAWSSYVEQVRVTGAEAVLVPPAAGCRPDLAALARAIGPRTRVVMVNSPCNPSGYVWEDDELAVLCDLALEHDLWVLSDEIYGRLVYEGAPAASPVSLRPEMRDRTAIVDGASKCYAMTGYRIGFLAGPAELVAAVERLHSQTTGAPNAVSQAAYRAALASDPPELAEMLSAFAERRALLLDGLERIGLPTPRPRGAYYAFPDVSAHALGGDSTAFCEALLQKEGLALVPGAAFGVEGHVRLSYATGTERIREALVRLERFLA